LYLGRFSCVHIGSPRESDCLLSITNDSSDSRSFKTDTQTLNGFAGIAPNFASNASFSDTRAGWTAGAGIEWMIFQRWSVKAEYLHYDLGSVTYNGQLGPVNTVAPFGNYFVNNAASTTRFNGDIVRAGLNYRW
jgi:opacity protein-like surface antigen